MDAKSLSKLGECHQELVRLFNAVGADIPILVICGHRGRVEQHQAFVDGKSKLDWPSSRHNTYPSQAVDVAPLPLRWDDTAAFDRFAVVVKAKARQLGIAVEWGGDWKMRDLVHWQLRRAAAAGQ